MNVAAPADPAFPDDAVEVGRIADAWGIKGWFKVQPFADDPQALFSSKRWFLRPPEEARPRPVPPAAGAASLPALLKIVESKTHGDFVVARAQEIDDRGAAERLRGARVFVGRSSFPSAAEDEWYWVDLIGCAVLNREQQPLGTVAGLIETGAHSVLRVRPDDPQADERLIPFVAAYIDTVDTAARRIVVDWGLDY